MDKSAHRQIKSLGVGCQDNWQNCAGAAPGIRKDEDSSNHNNRVTLRRSVCCSVYVERIICLLLSRASLHVWAIR